MGSGTFKRNNVQLDALQTDLWMHLNKQSECELISLTTFQGNNVQLDALQMDLWMHLNQTSSWILGQMDLPGNLGDVLVWMPHRQTCGCTWTLLLINLDAQQMVMLMHNDKILLLPRTVLMYMLLMLSIVKCLD